MISPIRRVEFARTYFDEVFCETLPTKWVESLANGAIGVMAGGSLGVAAIGQALAEARDLSPKHAVKQVDRLVSNRGIVIWDLFDPWIGQIVGKRKKIVIAMDWTDFDARAH